MCPAPPDVLVVPPPPLPQHCVESALVAFVHAYQLTVSPYLLSMLQKVQNVDMTADLASLRIKEAGESRVHCVTCPLCHVSAVCRLPSLYAPSLSLFLPPPSQCTMPWVSAPSSCMMTWTMTPGTKHTSSRSSLSRTPGKVHLLSTPYQTLGSRLPVSCLSSPPGTRWYGIVWCGCWGSG